MADPSGNPHGSAAAGGQQAPRLVKAAAALSVLSAVSKLLGFGREAALAAVFGASAATDAYLVAMIVPALLFGLVGSVLTTVGVPVYAEYLARPEKRPALPALLWTSFHLVLIATATLAGAGAMLAESLTRGVAPGFPPETLAAAVSLTRVLMPAILFMALAGWAAGVLNAHQHFLVPAAIGLPYNVILISAIVAAGSLGGGIGWVAWATVLAVAVQFLVQVPVLARLAPRYRPAFQLRHPGLLRMARLAVPVLLGVGANQINTIVDRMLASGLPAGSISALSYAQRALQVPYGLLGVPVVTVLYPTLAARAAQGDGAGYRAAISRGLTSLALVMVPVTAGLILLRADLVRFLYERGAFSAADTARTAPALFLYALGLVFIVGREYLSRASYALQDTWTPLWTGLVSVAANVALNLLLVGRFGLGGLALATSAASAVGFGLLLLFLRRRLGSIGGARLVREGAKIALATAAMSAAVLVLDRGGVEFLGWGWVEAGVRAVLGAGGLGAFVALGLRLVVLAGLGALVYAAACRALRVEDLRFVLDFVWRVGRRLTPARVRRRLPAGVRRALAVVWGR